MAQTDPTKKKKATASSSKTSSTKNGKTPTRTSGTTTTKKSSGSSGTNSSVKKIVKVQKGVTDGKSGQSGSYVFYKNPTDKGFNVKKDREFVNKSGMRLAREAGATPSKKSAKKG